MRTYFLYGVPFYEDILQIDKNGHIKMLIDDLAVNETFVKQLKQSVPLTEFNTFAKLNSEPDTHPKHIIPNFYTLHYRRHHTPYYVDVPNREATLPRTALSQHPLFQDTPIETEITLKWDFIFGLETCPVINIVLECQGPLSSNIAYRLSSLHLSDYVFIPGHLFADLFPDELPPDYLNLHQVREAIQRHIYTLAGLNEFLLEADLEALVHVPFTAIEVTGDYHNQQEFIDGNRAAIVDLISKPLGYEFEQGSATHEGNVLSADRVWSVAQDTLFVVAYTGGLYVKLKHLDKGRLTPISNFRLADENSVFHSFWLATSTYYLLRIVDEELDMAIQWLKREITKHRDELQRLYVLQEPNEINTLSRLNDLVIQTSELRFQFLDLQEELDNADKLIDDEWHIALLDKINDALAQNSGVTISPCASKICENWFRYWKTPTNAF